MAKDDIVLGVDLGRLKIEPVKINRNVKEEHPIPFISVQQVGITCGHNAKNTCSSATARERCKNCAIIKKKPKKVLKEPVLKLLQNHPQKSSIKEIKKDTNNLFGAYSSNVISDTLSLCTLVDNCNQLRISGCNERQVTNRKKSNEKNWWKLSTSDKRSPDPVGGKSQTGSCSQQALNPPCDVTIDELASYFETLVHIPKKMSSMAEMMYI